MTEQLAPQYNPSTIESALYAWWQERGLFSPDAGARAPDARPYVIVMPCARSRLTQRQNSLPGGRTWST